MPAASASGRATRSGIHGTIHAAIRTSRYPIMPLSPVHREPATRTPMVFTPSTRDVSPGSDGGRRGHRPPGAIAIAGWPGWRRANPPKSPARVPAREPSQTTDLLGSPPTRLLLVSYSPPLISPTVTCSAEASVISAATSSPSGQKRRNIAHCSGLPANLASPARRTSAASARWCRARLSPVDSGIDQRPGADVIGAGILIVVPAEARQQRRAGFEREPGDTARNVAAAGRRS